MWFFEVAHKLTLVAPFPGAFFSPQGLPVNVLIPLSQLTRMFQSTRSVLVEMEAVKDVFGYVSCGIA